MQVKAARREGKRTEEALLMGSGGRAAANVRTAQGRIRRELPSASAEQRAALSSAEAECAAALQEWRDANSAREVCFLVIANVI